jgi:predicted Rossmann fold nucleotide-binding protein DprA/Smf involved in DNA uptake
MNMSLSPNTKAVLLLTAPLIVGRAGPSTDLLTQVEYKKLVQFLREKQRQPADLIAPGAQDLLGECKHLFDYGRLMRLLDRGFLLSQAIERWQTRAMWVLSRAEPEYPRRLKTRLKEDSPPILYGCGETAILDTGGLAVVGSRNVDDDLVAHTESIGRLVASARRTLVSGGARGIDQAAMRGALEVGGRVVGVLADGLERAVMNREHRNLLMDGQLVLVSPYDPVAGFNVGHAMQRNKLIYALADAALVVSSDYEKGGTWSGAVEQLDKLRFVTVYVRSKGKIGKGLEALRRKGAFSWPNPETPEELTEALAVEMISGKDAPEQNELFAVVREEPKHPYKIQQSIPLPKDSLFIMSVESALTPADELFAKARELLGKMKTPKTLTEVAAELNVSRSQAKEWLQRLVQEGKMKKLGKPARYRPELQHSLLTASIKSALTPADELFAKVRELLSRIKTPQTDAEVAAELNVSRSQAKEWLQRLVQEGKMKKLGKPVRYRLELQHSLLE